MLDFWISVIGCASVVMIVIVYTALSNIHDRLKQIAGLLHEIANKKNDTK